MRSADAKVREAEERKIAEEEARTPPVSARPSSSAEREAAEARKREEEDAAATRKRPSARPSEVAKKRFGEAQRPRSTRRAWRSDRLGAAPVAAHARRREAEEDERRPRAPRRPAAAPVRPAVAAVKPPRAGAPKQRGRLTSSPRCSADEVRERSVASFRRRTQRMTGHRDDEPKEKLIARGHRSPRPSRSRNSPTAWRSARVDVIRMLMKQGQMAKITDVIDADTAQLIAEELGHTVRRVAESDVEEGLFDAADEDGDAGAAPAGRHHHGPCRPRQDLAARRDPPDQRGVAAKPAASPSISAPIR